MFQRIVFGYDVTETLGARRRCSPCKQEKQCWQCLFSLSRAAYKPPPSLPLLPRCAHAARVREGGAPSSTVAAVLLPLVTPIIVTAIMIMASRHRIVTAAHQRHGDVLTVGVARVFLPSLAFRKSASAHFGLMLRITHAILTGVNFLGFPLNVAISTIA